MPSRTVRNISTEALKQFHPFKMTPRVGVDSAIRQESAKETAYALAKALKERFKASRVMLFGSVARADCGQWSDIDLAVWGISITDYYKAVAFASGYSSIFKVDLVDADDCSQSLLQHITDNGIEI